MKEYICTSCKTSFRTSIKIREELCYTCYRVKRDIQIKEYQEKAKAKRREAKRLKKEAQPREVKFRKPTTCASPVCDTKFTKINTRHKYCCADCRIYVGNKHSSGWNGYSNCEYRERVWNLTENQPLEGLDNFENRAWRKYHVDHIVAISVGKKYGIPEEKIGSIQNLQMMHWKDNYQKGNTITPKAKRLLIEWGYGHVLTGTVQY